MFQSSKRSFTGLLKCCILSMIVADWAHGYNIEVPYTYGYYRETSPQWLRWATYLGGRKPPSGKKIRYLELGCGQGFNLLLHASSHPSMEFLGIDFNPSHIAHAEELVRLSGLTNVKFVEGDFLELEKEWPKEYGTFHYVVLHGTWSWVSKDVRKALINILRKVVVPGGIVYISYNALPGWLPGSIVRETLLAFKKISQLPASSSATEGLKVLKRIEELGAAVFSSLPALKPRLENFLRQDPAYLVGEFMHETHRLFWVHEVIEEALSAKLYYAATCTLPENFLPALLPEDARRFIMDFSHPVFRLFLTDLFINQAFRRDLYQKGVVQPSLIEQMREILSEKFIKISEPPPEWKFTLTFGEVTARREIYEPILEEVSKGAKSVEELLKLQVFKERGLTSLIQAISLLLDRGVVAPYNEGNNPDYTRKLVKTIIQRVDEGRNYSYLPCPMTGLGVFTTLLDLLTLSSYLEGGRNVEQLAARTHSKLVRLGRNLVKDGRELTDEREKLEYLAQISQDFLNKTLPAFRSLKIIE